MADDQVDPVFVAAIMEPMVSAWTEEQMPRMMGSCVLVLDHDSWCQAHDSLWMTNEPVCRRISDLQDIVERAIIAWETRHGG